MAKIKFETLDQVLDSLKKKSLEEIKAEFKSLLTAGKSDSTAFIKETAQNTARWLLMLANKELTQDEVSYLLKKQKKTAQIFGNTQSILVRSRVQKLAYRLLDISIDVLLGSIAIV